MSASTPSDSSSGTLPLKSESKPKTTTSTPSFESGAQEQGARLVRYNKGIPEDVCILGFDECSVYIRNGITRTIFRDGRPDLVEETPLLDNEEPEWVSWYVKDNSDGFWDEKVKNDNNTTLKNWYELFKRGEDSFFKNCKAYTDSKPDLNSTYTYVYLRSLRQERDPRRASL